MRIFGDVERDARAMPARSGGRVRARARRAAQRERAGERGDEPQFERRALQMPAGMESVVLYVLFV